MGEIITGKATDLSEKWLFNLHQPPPIPGVSYKRGGVVRILFRSRGPVHPPTVLWWLRQTLENRQVFLYPVDWCEN